MRVQAVKSLFEKSFRPDHQIAKTEIAGQVITKQKEIDNLIAKYAPAWPLEQIAPVDLATLRLAVWELFFRKTKEPYKVVIDEAVEIAKEYSSASSASFVNGVLGSIIKSKVKVESQKQEP